MVFFYLITSPNQSRTKVYPRVNLASIINACQRLIIWRNYIIIML